MLLNELEDMAKGFADAMADIVGPEIGFTLFLYQYEKNGWLTYISKSEREGNIGIVMEWLARQQDNPGTSPEIKDKIRKFRGL